MAAAATYKPPVTMSSLRDYVAGADGGMQQMADSTVVLYMTHNHLNARFPEIRLDLHVRLCGVPARGAEAAAAANRSRAPKRAARRVARRPPHTHKQNCTHTHTTNR
jgi:hypothetical protein